MGATAAAEVLLGRQLGHALQRLGAGVPLSVSRPRRYSQAPPGDSWGAPKGPSFVITGRKKTRLFSRATDMTPAMRTVAPIAVTVRRTSTPQAIRARP